MSFSLGSNLWLFLDLLRSNRRFWIFFTLVIRCARLFWMMLSLKRLIDSLSWESGSTDLWQVVMKSLLAVLIEL